MPEGVAVVAKDQWEIGNQMGVDLGGRRITKKWMEEELQSEYEDPSIKIPIDKMDCDIVYTINPREVKYDPRTIAEAAAIFHFAGENWTMPSDGWDMTNFGLFNGDDELGAAVSGRVYDAVERLRGKKLVMSECGHGYRSTRCEGPNWGRRDVNFEMESAVITMLRYVKEGRIQVDKAKNREPVTFHDSCNNARSCGMFEEPRELLNLVCTDFREMYPNRAENYCCTGGGGAMSMAEYTPRRLKSAKIKADQLRATGAKIVVTSCHNCVDGLFDLIKHYKLDMQVKLLVNLVASALVVPERPPVRAKLLDGYKILVIDDEPDVRVYLRMIFKEQGAEVVEAPDANQAMRAILSEKPDLITLDLVLPHKTGEKFYWELRKDERFADVPVVVVSGYARIDSPKIDFTGFIAEKKIPEPEGFLEKPIDPERLVETAIDVLATKPTVKS
jgi:CheY-like chemotaxis protein